LCSIFMNIEQQLRDRVGESVFFYVTLDPERALGIEDVLPNYTIICPYTSRLIDDLRARGVAVVVLEEELGAQKN